MLPKRHGDKDYSTSSFPKDKPYKSVTLKDQIDRNAQVKEQKRIIDNIIERDWKLMPNPESVVKISVNDYLFNSLDAITYCEDYNTSEKIIWLKKILEDVVTVVSPEYKVFTTNTAVGFYRFTKEEPRWGRNLRGDIEAEYPFENCYVGRCYYINGVDNKVSGCADFVQKLNPEKCGVQHNNIHHQSRKHPLNDNGFGIHFDDLHYEYNARDALARDPALDEDFLGFVEVGKRKYNNIPSNPFDFDGVSSCLKNDYVLGQRFDKVNTAKRDAVFEQLKAHGYDCEIIDDKKIKVTSNGAINFNIDCAEYKGKISFDSCHLVVTDKAIYCKGYVYKDIDVLINADKAYTVVNSPKNSLMRYRKDDKYGVDFFWTREIEGKEFKEQIEELEEEKEETKVNIDK